MVAVTDSHTDSHAIFAYGSNMHMGDLARWHRERQRGLPTVHAIEVAVLGDHALCWDYHSASRGAGAANVRPAPGAQVKGLLLHVDAPTFENLDLKEGYPSVYGRAQLPLSVAGRSHPAWVYAVTPAHRQPRFVAPRAGYRQLMLDAAAQYDFGDDYARDLLQLDVVG